MVLKVESDMFCFCFSYGSATLSVLSIVLIKGYMMNSKYQILNSTSFETVTEWFSPFPSSFSVLCPGICALLLWKEVSSGLCHNLYHAEEIKSIFRILVNFKKKKRS